MDWWHKIMGRIILLLVGICFITACASTEIYVHPSIQGQFIDKSTNQPVRDTSYIASTIGERNFGKNFSNSNGNFRVIAEKQTYISESVYRGIPKNVLFLVDGFERVQINYLKYPMTPSHPSRSEEAVVDIGKVYLDRKK